MKIKHIRFHSALAADLEKEAKKRDRSISWLVRYFVRQGLDQDQSKKEAN